MKLTCRAIFFVTTSAIFSSSLALAGYGEKDESLTPKVCSTAKEYITVLEYLRDHKEYGLSEKEIRDTADKVAPGCTGAALRFTKTFEVLLKTEAGARGSLDLAIQLAQKSDSYTEAFLGVFRRSYLAEYLDLDFNTAYTMAKSLSADYLGDPVVAKNDFVDLVEFCTDDEHLGLSKPRCGVIAGRIIKKAENFNISIVKNFKQIFNFIISQKGPTPDLIKALEIAEEITAIGPEAPENFIMAYNYGVKDDGLNLTAAQALGFAKKISQNAFHKAIDLQPRIPASTVNSEDDED